LRCVEEVPRFDPSAGGPAYMYVKVADHVALRIAAGELGPGSSLPNERDMAAEYGVAIGTVRRAVEELRDRGLVVTLAAKGTFVAGQPVAEEQEGPQDGESASQGPG
jgi:GntR family transcriptional regulator